MGTLDDNDMSGVPNVPLRGCDGVRGLCVLWGQGAYGKPVLPSQLC